MSTFRNMLKDNIRGVFLNERFFGERVTIGYDGETFEDVLVSKDGPNLVDKKQQSQGRQMSSDYTQGRFLQAVVLHLDRRDLGDKLPKKGAVLTLQEEDGARHYRILDSHDSFGMLRVELEAVRS